MKKITRQFYTGERALFAVKDLHLVECTFDAGESPLKESNNLLCDECLFKWKYPLWYCNDVSVNDSTLFATARAGVWYTRNVSFSRCVVEAPKTFRRSVGVTLTDVTLSDAAETLWNCTDVTLNNVTARGAYFAMGCKNVVCDNLTLTGDYCFDGAENVTIRNSRLLSKDSFWNSSNVTVSDSFISGEYLCWNARNITFVNCTLESLQGLCYVDGLKLVNCKLINTTRAFEYSSVNAEITGSVDSIVNPASGSIVADGVGSLTLDKRYINPTDVTVKIRESK